MQRGVISGRNSLVMHEQGLPIKGQPGTILGLDFVGNKDMGMQIRIPCAGIEVSKLCGNNAACSDLGDAFCSSAGTGNLGINEV